MDDSNLQHHGVLGMKWGVRKADRKAANKRVKADVKSGKITKKQGRQKKADNYHKSKGDMSIYKRSYQQSLGKGNTHRVAMRDAKIGARLSKVAIAATVIIHGGEVAARHTAKAVKKVATPENIRKGKNVIQAAKGSKFRYADANQMTNLVKNGMNVTKALKSPQLRLGR